MKDKMKYSARKETFKIIRLAPALRDCVTPLCHRVLFYKKKHPLVKFPLSYDPVVLEGLLKGSFRY